MSSLSHVWRWVMLGVLGVLFLALAGWTIYQVGHQQQQLALPQSAPPAPGTAEKEKTEQPLTVNFTGPVGWGTRKHEFIRVIANGAPPASTSTALLVSADGTNSATIKETNTLSCAGQPERKTTLGSIEWCLDVQGLRPGSDVTGLVEGQDTNLKLTIALRDHFFVLPLAVAFLALVGAIGVAAIGPDFLGRWLRGRRLKKELAQNAQLLEKQKKRPGEESLAISGLDAGWVNATALDCHGNTLLRTIIDVRALGPDRAKQARERLRSRLDKLDQLPLEHPLRQAEHPLRKAAQTEADLTASKPDAYKIADFLDATAKPVTHPADNMIATLDRFEAVHGHLQKLEKHIQTSGISGGTRQMLLAQLHEVQRFEAEAGGESSITDVETLAKQLQQDVVEAVAQPPAPRVSAAARLRRLRPVAQPPGLRVSAAAQLADVAGGQATIPVSRISPPAAPLVAEVLTGARVPSRTIRTGRWWPSFTGDLAIFLAFLALIAVAVIGVAVTDYFPTPTFGSSADYFKLFAAGITAGTASSILASLFLWKPSAQD